MYRQGIAGILSHPDNWILREKLIKNFPTPEFKLRSELIASPLTSNHGVVGMAFDYIFCKHVRSLNQTNSESQILRPTVSDFAALVDYILNYPLDVIPLDVKKKSRFEILRLYNDNFWPLVKKGELSKQNLYKRQMLTDEQLLEKFERYNHFIKILYPHHSSSMLKHDINDVKDICALNSIVDNQFFTAKRKCYLSPTFGETSVILGGVGDLIIDNTLIDIKTTKKLTLTREYFNQLVCYYILNLIGGVNENPQEKPIENIGIYFARYGILWSMPISKLGDSRKFENFRKWFISFLRKKGIADLRGIYKQTNTFIHE